jgi:hypothetical protein
LFVVVVSPGTGSMSTLIVVGWPNSVPMSMFVKVTVFVSPALMTSIVFFLTIGRGDLWIVSVTTTLNSWKSPESSTATWKARSVDTVIWLSLALPPGSRRLASGRAVTDTSALPCRPPGVPPVAAPWTRRHTVVIACVLARSGFGKMSESGTPPMSRMFWFSSSLCVGSLK